MSWYKHTMNVSLQFPCDLKTCVVRVNGGAPTCADPGELVAALISSVALAIEGYEMLSGNERSLLKVAIPLEVFQVARLTHYRDGRSVLDAVRDNLRVDIVVNQP